MILLLVGKSGVGKTSIELYLGRRPGWTRIVSTTTRPQRHGEEEGIHYCFTDPTKFRMMIKSGDMFEHTEYNEYLYGFTKSEVQRAIQAADNVVATVDSNGVRAFIEAFGRENLVIALIRVPEPMRIIRILEAGSPEDRAARVEDPEYGIPYDIAIDGRTPTMNTVNEIIKYMDETFPSGKQEESGVS